jgi:hypothetical protein
MLRSAVPVLATLALVAVPAGMSAQEKPAGGQKPAQPRVPLEVTLVIARYQGEKADKLVSRLPFTFRVNTHDQSTQLRVGADVPIPTESDPVTSYRVRSIGTSIDTDAEVLEGGRYRLHLIVNDSQVSAATAQGGSARPPSVQSFTFQNHVIIRDGETVQFTTAADKATGETIKVDVTVNVVK